MSEATAKAARRQLRRAMGDEAVSVVNKHGEAINELARRFSAELEQQRRLTVGDLASVHNAIATVQREQRNLRLSFLARLWWLLTGQVR